uniref:Large ribosomal subunit protein bL21c n=1 Tax=Cyanophora paradoxa TaxID=2762 RepID=RK21_CYAPA|nr:ribosomal protein L21 [Cyanophora paradoxa]P48128.1 RecName: Full=Large ribosomal subunit protein bL21c; AltName: Full=50S ribosomal protein L21, cyanelle [Cyanophora paradoxa]AAA81318.1 ribosomal protein L21 [Cyanophora paradoxa]
MTTYAIIDIAGKQLWVEPKRYYSVNKINVEIGKKIALQRILLLSKIGEKIKIGQPFLNGISINAIILRHFLAPKVIVYKMQPKKKTRRKRGHRQHLTSFLINDF